MPLAADTVVSMNLWGFKTDLFEYLEKGFVDFLKEKINVPKSEYLLPYTVTDIMKEQGKEVKVLVAEDKWYGVTYKEDKPKVVEAISGMIDRGLYKF